MKKLVYILFLVSLGLSSCKKSMDPDPEDPNPPASVGSLTENALIAYSPGFPEDNQEITLVFNANKGNQGLKGIAGDVYIWTGVITDKSTSGSDWKYVKSSNFNQADANAKMTKIGNDKFQLKINPRSYYGVPDGEKILKIAMLFKNADGSKVARNTDGSDIYMPINSAGNSSVRFLDPEMEPLFIPSAKSLDKSVGQNLKVTAIASKVADLTLYLNGTSVATASNASTITADVNLTKTGTNELKVTAAGGAEQVINFTVNGTVQVADLPAGAKDGVTYINGGTSAIFNLYAPNKSNVYLIGDFNNWQASDATFMKRTSDGKRWWIQVDGLTAGKQYAYQYLVDGNLRIADPYTELVLDPNNDKYIPGSVFSPMPVYPAGKTTGIVSIMQSNAVPYSWQVPTFTRPEKEKLVIYELHLRDFLGTHSYSTLTDTLSYLSRMGINAVELMPVNEFEGNESWGYNPSFYFTPDKYYGTKNALKTLIDECHKRGMAVIIDMVLNHSFGQSPMVQLYFDNASGKPTVQSPWFNADPTHPYNVGYDFNHESVDTKYFVKQVLKFWLEEYKVDGYRFDLSKGFTQKNSGDNVGAWGNYDASRVAIWKDYNNYIRSIDANAYVILEHFAADQEEQELANAGMILWNNLNGSYTEASMGYTSNLNRAFFGTHGFTNPNLVTYMESHDEERMMYKNKTFGNNANASYNVRTLSNALKRQEMAAAFFFTIPGPNMVWQFGELGYDVSIDFNGRVGNKPIHWDYQQDANRKQLYDVFSKLIKLKTKSSILQTSDYTYSVNGSVKSITINNGANKIVVVGNFDVYDQSASITFPQVGTWYDYINGSSISLPSTNYSQLLAPGEYHVYTTNQLSF